MPQAPIPQNKINVGGASKVMTSMAFIVSVVVHLVLFLFVGSVVIFEGAIPPNLFTSMGGEMVADDSGSDEMELPPLMEEELEPEPMETPMDEIQMETEVDLSDAMSSSDLIIANTVAPSFAPSMPKPMMGVGTGEGTKIISGLKPKGGGGGAKGPGTPRTANIFGRTVSASNFGAILDISFSTHNTIDTAVNEIKEGFPDAILVLAPGCGMNAKETGEVIDGKTFGKNIDDYTYQGKNKVKGYYSAPFFQALLSKNKNFEKLWERAVRDNRGYVLHLNIPDEVKEDKIARISGTQHGFDFLIEQGCDMIYWMADFDDKVNADVAEDTVKMLKRKDVKVILHDFNGGDQLSKGKDGDIRSSFAKETDGEVIIGSGK